ncbi:restriction endonuclease subunit S [Nocardiopsis dassonvillei]|uniref:restriction endonuclease subunit S n=1 Tax=Nocardiopsis dassonvillei TaxID=2014 RepID=UPI0033E2FE65
MGVGRVTLSISPEEIVAKAEAGAAGLIGRHATWGRVPLGDVATVVNGAPFPSREFNSSGVGLPLIRIRDVVRGYTETYFDGEFSKEHLVYPGDLLVGMDGDFNSSIWPGPRGLLNQRVCKVGVRNSDLYDQKFLALVLQGYLDALWSETSSVTVKHLSSRSVQKIPLPLPPLAEQRRIVAALEAELSRLDATSALLSRSAFQASQILVSSAQRAVRGDLRSAISARAEGGVDLECLMELRKQMALKKKSPEPPFGEIDFQLPTGWRMASIGQLSWSIEYGTSLKASDSRPEDGVPVLRMGNIRDGKIDTGKLKYLPRLPEVESLILEDGDFLFNRTNSAELVGKSAVYKGELGAAVYASYLIRCRFVPGVDPDWVSLVVNSAFGRSYISKVVSQQVGQANVNGTKLAAFPIPLPSLSRQREILDAYKTWVLAVERLKGGLRAAQSQSLALRRSLLASAFTGNIVPQDPSDESVFELLSRIRAEKEGALKTKRGRRTKTSQSPKDPVLIPENPQPVSAGEQTALEF